MEKDSDILMINFIGNNIYSISKYVQNSYDLKNVSISKIIPELNYQIHSAVIRCTRLNCLPRAQSKNVKN